MLDPFLDVLASTPRWCVHRACECLASVARSHSGAHSATARSKRCYGYFNCLICITNFMHETICVYATQPIVRARARRPYRNAFAAAKPRQTHFSRCESVDLAIVRRGAHAILLLSCFGRRDDIWCHSGALFTIGTMNRVCIERQKPGQAKTNCRQRRAAGVAKWNCHHNRRTLKPIHTA